MDKNWFLDRHKAALLLIDVQERLFPLVENHPFVLIEIEKAIKGCNILNLPIVITEQYPEKMGKTVTSLDGKLQEKKRYSKTTFSCLKDPIIANDIQALPVKQWILAGIEAHVCVLQTAKDLIQKGYQVAVLNNAISSRSIYDYSTAIAEMRDIGVRIISVEIALFELMGNSKIPEFKDISALIK